MTTGTEATHRPTVVVWNDSVNLRAYVTWVFCAFLGTSASESEALMLRIHNDGSAAIFRGDRARCEQLITDLHVFGLWATLQGEV